MPHSSSSHWKSIVFNQEVTNTLPRSVEELAELSRAGLALPPHLTESLPEIGHMYEGIQLRDGDLTPAVEIYVPDGSGPFPVVVNIHGGAWYTGSVRLDRRFGRTIAQQGFVVVNVEYGLAPDNPFPRGLEDCVYAVRWTARNIAAYNGDPNRIFCSGSSAGGNLAAATVLALHGSDAGLDANDMADVKVSLAGLVLLYAVLDVHHWLAEPHYYAGEIEIILAGYLGPNFTPRLREPLVSPIENPHLSALPPVYLSCGSQDALLTHSLSMTKALVDADTDVTLSVLAGADHEFHKAPEFVPGAAEETGAIVDWLHLHSAQPGSKRPPTALV